MPGTVGWLVCTAHKTNGEPCRAPVIRGAKVCKMHGGMAGHVREAARLRLERLVDPAISTVREMMLRGDSHTVRLKAAESILDRAGIIAEQKVEVDNQVSVTVTYEDVALAHAIVDVTPNVLGSANGHQKTPPERGDDEDGTG